MGSGLIEAYFGFPIHAGGATTGGIVFAWAAAATYLLVGAVSLRLFARPTEGEPIWFTEAPRFPLIVSLLIAVGEEALFRGYLQSFSMTFVEPVYAVFAVNLLFAAIHSKGGLTFAMSAGFFGVLASVMTLASASLMPAIAMHVGWNLLVAIARGREQARLGAGATASD